MIGVRCSPWAPVCSKAPYVLFFQGLGLVWLLLRRCPLDIHKLFSPSWLWCWGYLPSDSGLLQEQPQLYDAVVLAAPLEQSRLKLQGIPAPILPARKYKRVVTTIVASPALRPAYFGVQKLPGELHKEKGA